MSIHGPCINCGATDYALSMGGPDICPPCDCGYTFSRQHVKDLIAEIESLKQIIRFLQKAVTNVRV